MRVGLIVYGGLETVSGGYLYDRKLVEYLQSQGDHVTLITLPWRNYLSHLGDNFSSDLTYGMRNLQADVFLQDELNHPSLFLVNERVRKQVSYPFVSIIHHLRISEVHPKVLKWIYRWVEARYLNSLDGIIYNSQTTKQAVETVVEIEFQTIVANPAADHLNSQISDEDITLRANQDGPLQLVFVGNVIPRKGLHTLIEAISRAEVNSMNLSIVGRLDADDRYARSIRKRASEAGFGKRVTFFGKLGNGELSQVLKKSHVLIVPSSYEGYGIVYLEGMGFGLPAIASNVGGAAEIITHGVDGFLIEPGAAGELLEYLNALQHNREMLRLMSLAALKHYKKHPGWRHTGELIRQYLQTVRRRDYASTY